MNPPHRDRFRLSAGAFRLLLASVALALIIGSTWLAALQADRELRVDLLQQARMVTAAVNLRQVAALSGTSADLASSDYQRIKEQLSGVRLSNPECRFLYLISRKSDGTIIFHMDSEPSDSKDYSPPGQTYDEAPGELHDVFATGRAAVRGPYHDRWGTWVSAFVPLPSRVAGSVQTVFGMDIAAADWIWTVAMRAVLPVALVVIAVMLGLLAALLQRSRRDIRSHQEMLRESEEKYRLLFEYSPLGHIYFDENGVIVACNNNFVHIIGSSREALIGLNMLNLPDKKIVSAVQKALNGGIGIYEDIYHSVTGKKMTPVRALFAPMNIGGGRILGSVGIIEDITDRKRVEEENRVLAERLQRAEKMEALGQLAGGVAHDLNNVLGIIVGYAELLLNEVDQSSPMRPRLLNIISGGERAAAIVQDLLTLARRGVPSRQILNLNKVIVEDQHSPEFEMLSSHHPAIQIKTNLETDLLNISGSPVHLSKTLFNLVSNASEAMPNGGTVTIKTANRHLDKPIQGYDEIQEGDYVVLSVSDTGEGIPAADLKHIFEPFYTKKVMGRSGTGLGLAVVWGTVKDHHGYINVQSEEGKGSAFTLYFPVTREEITTEHAAANISEYMGRGEAILVVDDFPGQRDLASEMLRNLNYRVTGVSSGEEAVAYVKEHKVDLMVLDMIMDPGMDGLDTYRSVREIYPKQKAVIVSGFSETERVSTAQTLGAGAYVRKPYILERLGMAVRKELDRYT